jgi:integrase
MKPSLTFPVLLTRFFSQRLIQQRQASPHTISSYRDTFRLLLQFARVRLGKEPSRLAWEDIDAPLIGAFLDDLQERRGIGTRSRNLRLTAIRSFFGYAAYELPERAEHIPSGPSTSNVFWRSRPNATPMSRSITCLGRKSMPCSRPRTTTPGLGAAITPGCCSLCRQVYVCPS